MSTKKFFKKTTVSKKVNAGGPPPEDQLLAMAEDRYWTICNSSLLQACGHDNKLIDRANAFKCALQTYGPTSDKLPDFRHNGGKAKNAVYHGHVTGSSGTTYVLEWTVIDTQKRIIALTGFATHENYAFMQRPMTNNEKEKLLKLAENKKIVSHVNQKVQEAKNKVSRVEYTYRNKL